jgi:glucan 1,3-beta-glucosidase
MLVSSSVLLGLLTCAVALNAGYSGGNAYTYASVYSEAEDESANQIVYKSKDIHPISAPSEYGVFGTTTTSVYGDNNGYPAYTLRPTHTHGASDIPYPTGTGVYASTEPSPIGTPNVSCTPYWLEDIKHQGLASFNSDPDSYQIFRNVKDFGAKVMYIL